MANGKGRGRSRLHICWGDRGHKKVCVTNPIEQACKDEVAGLIKARLEQTMPPGGRKRPANPDAHSILVTFQLGADGKKLPVDPITVSLSDLRKGDTAALYTRIDEARSAACHELKLPLEPAEVAT